MAKAPTVTVKIADLRWGQELAAAARRGVEDGTLDCVVRGEHLADGSAAPECAEIISNPLRMCAGCRIRLAVGAPRRPDHDGEKRSS